MNAVDWIIIGEAKLVWWIIPIMLFAGFVTPWPYNYYRLKKFLIPLLYKLEVRIPMNLQRLVKFQKIMVIKKLI